MLISDVFHGILTEVDDKFLIFQESVILTLFSTF